MGPGNVQEVYPSHKQVIGSKYIQVGFVDEKVQDSTASVMVEYSRGRLHKIGISYKGRQIDSYSDVLANRSDGVAWRMRLLNVLKQSYGDPACAPSQRTLTNNCASFGSECGELDSAKRNNLLRWVWRTTESEVVLIGGYVPQLIYSDLSRISVVRRAKEIERAEREAEKELRASMDRERIGGQAKSQLPIPARSPEIEIADDLSSVPPIECPLGEKEPSPDSTTLPSAWSKNGWSKFRWGMGPGDVKGLLDLNMRTSSTWHPGSLGAADMLYTEGFQFLSRGVITYFHFKNGSLISISFALQDCLTEKGEREVACDRWHREVINHFDRKFGPGRCTKEKVSERCHWDYPEKEWVTLNRDDGIWLRLSLDNPSLKPKRIIDKSQLKGTSEKVWSKYGWNTLRWGMGVADVQKRLADSQGDIKARGIAVCYQAKEEIAEIVCQIERDFHNLSIQNSRPNLSFKFLNGRLFNISLGFINEDDKSYWQNAETLQQLLTDKYGRPTEDQPSNRGGYKYLNRRWTVEGLRVRFFAEPKEMSIEYDDPSRDAGVGSPAGNGGVGSRL